MSDMSDTEDQSTTSEGKFDPKRHAREQHNALERRRRDNIKDMYTSLREVVPDTNGERVQASRAVILKKAIETIEKGHTESAALSAEINQQEAKNAKLREEVFWLKSIQLIFK
ncbi:CRE-MXL-1 protein [Caenorhabditis remanei]|uniref:CRE-MXL-1 protein n=1 Tax=Caenorhabditis remanei TaxID=31234 RepID=E3NKZ2_CAERE|nr:CRE-MXL-1 protein [Caenorhabditis remanei]